MRVDEGMDWGRYEWREMLQLWGHSVGAQRRFLVIPSVSFFTTQNLSFPVNLMLQGVSRRPRTVERGVSHIWGDQLGGSLGELGKG